MVTYNIYQIVVSNDALESEVNELQILFITILTTSNSERNEANNQYQFDLSSIPDFQKIHQENENNVNVVTYANMAAGGRPEATPTHSNLFAIQNTHRPNNNGHSAHSTNKRNNNVNPPADENTTGYPKSQYTSGTGITFGIHTFPFKFVAIII